MYDIVIIGAGIIGTSLASQLGHYDLKILVLEKNLDVSEGATKANSGIVHAGYDCSPGTLKARFNVEGAKMYPQIVEDLKIPYRKAGSLVLAHNKEEQKSIKRLLKQGIENGVDSLRIIDIDEIKEMVPGINPTVTQALYASEAAIISPYEAAIAFSEHAIINGVEFKLGTIVSEIETIDDYFIVNQEYKTKYIVNASGIYADKIASLINDSNYQITPRRGEYFLLDKSNYLSHKILFQAPSSLGKGVLIAPTTHGNTLIGPNAENIADREDISTTLDGLNQLIDKAELTIEKIDYRTAITNYAGLRAISGNDFIIEPSSINPHMIHALGICSPGLASAPAIAKYLVKLLSEQGLKLIHKDNYISTLPEKVITRQLKSDEYATLIKANPKYGTIVCRCEQISEQEILDALQSPLSPTTVDGLKRRVRTGMGRCQGGFCSTRLMELISEYHHLDILNVTKSTASSKILIRKTKGDSHE